MIHPLTFFRSLTSGSSFLRLFVLRCCRVVAVVGAFALGPAVFAAEPSASTVRQLSEFGDVGPKQLAETYQKAIAELRESGITKAASAPAATPKVASLTVSRATGEFQFTGEGVQAGGTLSGVTGLSGDAQPANNLRGKNVTVDWMLVR